MEQPTFTLASDGYPIPGQVVRYYRERMTYTDKDGKEKRWTQADLARRLGVSEQMVRLMETKNQGLNDIDRRRAIAALLKIPPALLGLSSLDDLQKILQGEDTHRSTTSAAMKHNTVDTAEIQLYQEALGIFKERRDQGALNPQIIETWITRITNTLKYNSNAKNDVLTELAKYHILAAKPYYNDLYDFARGKQHLQEAKEIAIILNSNELLTTACYYTSEMYLSHKKPLLACNELESAVNVSSGQVKGYILADLALAKLRMDDRNIPYSRSLLDKAEKYMSDTTDNIFIRFDTVQYLECKAETLIASNRFQLALECIDETDDYVDTRPNIARNTEYLKILRAECYIKQRKPDYEEALRILSQVLNKNAHIQHYVKHVTRLHKMIGDSSYGNAPAVTDLEMALRSLGGAKQ